MQRRYARTDRLTSVHYLEAPEILKTADDGNGYWAKNVLRNVPVLVQRATYRTEPH